MVIAASAAVSRKFLDRLKLWWWLWFTPILVPPPPFLGVDGDTFFLFLGGIIEIRTETNYILIQVLCSTARGRVTGFANVLGISGPIGVETRAGTPVIGQREHVQVTT